VADPTSVAVRPLSEYVIEFKVHRD